MFVKDWQSPGIRAQEMTGLGVEERHCPDLTQGLLKHLNQRQEMVSQDGPSGQNPTVGTEWDCWAA